MSIRNKNCYICGEPFHTYTTSAKMQIIDGKERRVHRDCYCHYKKAKIDLGEPI